MTEYNGGESRQTVPLNGSTDVPAPLYGCVICCTSVPDEKRTQLAEYAKQMGAVHTYDLTLEVTHLIVGEYDTPKYRYVAQKRMDVQPMMMTWIEAVRELWINDQEIDMELLEEEHRLPTFHSLKFSMTGCDDPAERLEIAEKVRANGAVYEGDLTKSITHLISFRTEGAKYKAAKSWKLHIVSIEWLRDSLERRMILDEKLYDPALPEDERGIGAWDKTKPMRTSLGKRSREDSTASVDGGRRKLRRTASTKLSTQNEQIWGDIVGGARGSMVPQVSRSGVWETNDEGMPNAISNPTSDPENDKQSKSMKSAIENQPSTNGVFSRCRFFLHGFPPKKTEVLHRHISSNGGEVAETLEDLSRQFETKQPNRLFRVVPHDLPVGELPPMPGSQMPIETITFWWVERCLHHKKFIDPNDHIVGRPFPKFPIEGFEGITISSSAFTGIDLLHFQQAVVLLGAKYSEDFTPETTVLVTKTMTGLRKDKYDHAQEWKIPIVNADWIWDCISSGVKLPSSKFRCRSQRRSDSLPNTRDGRMAKPPSRHERSNSDITRTASRASSYSSKSSMKPPRHSGLDNTAFASDEAAHEPAEASKKAPRASALDDTAFAPDEPTETEASVPDELEEPPVPSEPVPKEEYHTQGFPLVPDASAIISQDFSHASEPLSEINGNSPTRTISTAPAPSDHPAPRQQEDMSNAISNLLAKAKTAPIHDAPEPQARKRGRILGRVTSNISTGSTNLSRATSVDSTATHGHPVEYPPYNSNDQTANERIQMLLNGDKAGEGVDCQPPATQLQYEDPDSTEAREMVMAKMRGEKVERRSGVRQKAITLGNFGDSARVTRRGAGKGGLR